MLVPYQKSCRGKAGVASPAGEVFSECSKRSEITSLISVPFIAVQKESQLKVRYVQTQDVCEQLK